MTRPVDAAGRRPRVFTIPAGTPFLDRLAGAFLSGALFGRDEPLSPAEIAAARIFVPTRRAGAALTTALANARPGQASLLPVLVPLGSEEALSESALGTGMDLASVRTIPAFDRRLHLFAMIDSWRMAMAAQRDAEGVREPFFVAAGRADAFALAADLARLIDETIIEDVPLERLAGALPEGYDPALHDTYWTLTQRFLEIAAAQWPAALAENDLLDEADALKRRMRALAADLALRNVETPVVIAGSTGSVAATADLMAVVARLPMGAVVLPGLDTRLDAASWEKIGHETSELPTRFAHPQCLIKRTLGRIGLQREEVVRLAGEDPQPAREALISEVFRPAETTALWQERALHGAALAQAVAGMAEIVAHDEREEALAIALALRETLEVPGRTAALVTPDRALARAVRMELGRWGIDAADSAGEPLATTPPATLARLILPASAPDCLALDALAVLRHPLATLGMAEARREAAVDAIEIAALRGKRLAGGTRALAASVRLAGQAAPSHRDPAPRRRLTPAALNDAAGLAGALDAALTPLAGVFAEGSAGLRAAAQAHRAALQQLCVPTTGESAAAGMAQQALDAIFDTISQCRQDGPAVSLAEYSAIFDQLVGEGSVPVAGGTHPRLRIWGLLEARLLEADRVILAGLDDGIWPPETRGDPFLNRPMRMALGLQPPERRVGQTAHDFSMLLGAGDILLTHARKRGGAPAIASRFLRRLTTYIGEETARTLEQRGQRYLDWARQLDAPANVRPAPRPAPRPPAHLTPARLALTEIETLYRDPYAIFARRVLKLEPLEPIDPALDARERGTVIHEALAAFTARFSTSLPADAEAALLELGREAFAQIVRQDPEAVEFWWSRFTHFVPWFVAWDRARRMDIAQLYSEVPGRLELVLAGGHHLSLSTRADRIEQRADGGLAIVDYKTGSPPGVNEVLKGLSPQLTLTAALAARGAFAPLGKAPLKDGVSISYLAVGLAFGEGKEQIIRAKDEPLADVIERQFQALVSHLDEYLLGTRGYLSHRIPKTRRYRSDFDHLARHLEWALGGENEGEDA